MSARLDHQKLRDEMKAQPLKQKPLAEQLNISDRYLRILLSKDTDVASSLSSLLYCLNKALQIPMEELLTMGEEQKERG